MQQILLHWLHARRLMPKAVMPESTPAIRVKVRGRFSIDVWLAMWRTCPKAPLPICQSSPFARLQIEMSSGRSSQSENGT